MGKYNVIRVEQSKFEGEVAIGQFPKKARAFSLRMDVKPHMHKPGEYYCGRCYHWVLIA